MSQLKPTGKLARTAGRFDRSPNEGLLPRGSHNDCSYSYGGEKGQTGLATVTTVYFTYCGIVHRAIRFWRHDYLRTGKIEIYTLEPWPGLDYTSSSEEGWYAYSSGDFFRYANEVFPSCLDVIAMSAIAAMSNGTYHAYPVSTITTHR